MIQLQVLGTIGLVGHDGVELRPVLSQAKRIGLLAYLALAEPAGFRRRDSLLALFWPELGADEARRALRQSIHFLRRHLGQDTIENRGTEEVGLSQVSIQCDALEFERRLARGEDARALELYVGDLLPGFHLSDTAPEFEEWLDQRRTGLRRAALQAARRAADRAGREGQAVEAKRWAQFAVDMDDAEDGDLLRLLRLLWTADHGVAAIAAYESYARRLRDRCDAVPGLAVRELVARIRAEVGTTTDSASTGAPAAGGAPVVAAADPMVPPGTEPTSRVVAPPRSSLVLRLAILGALVLAGIFVTLRALPSRHPEPVAAVDSVPRVAVAIFANRAGDSSLELIGTMTADWVARGLSRIPRIEVLDLRALYTQGRRRTGEPVDPVTLARASKSAYVVGGAFDRVGPGTLRFSGQVLDGRTGGILRTVDPIDAPVGDPLRAVNELRSRLISAVQSIVDPRAVMLDAPVQTPPRYEAFQEFIKGQEAFWSTNYSVALAHQLRAASLDSTFAMAKVFVTVAAVSAGRCGLVDSVARSIEERPIDLTEFEQTTLRLSSVRCLRDWPTGVFLQRRRLELQPKSPVVRWTAAQTFILANRPGPAIALYRDLDPKRDLAWLDPSGRSAYWGEAAAAYHELGDFAGERRVAEALASSGDDPSRTAFLAARSLAAAGDAAGALSAVAPLAQGPFLPIPPAAVAADRLGAFVPSPVWMMAQVAAELAAHGLPAAAESLALRTADLLKHRAAGGSPSVVERYALGRAWLASERYQDARAIFATLVRDDSTNIRFRGTLGAISARLGDQRTANATRRWLAGLTNVMPPGLPGYYLATIASAGGDLDGALDLIEGLPYGAHPNEFLEFHVDPLLAPLRATERFRRFVRPRE